MNDNAFKIKTIELNGAEYLKLSSFLEPAGVKAIYNRSLHKINFNFAKNIFAMSPVSGAVSVNGKVDIFEKPVVVNRGVVHISKETAVYIAPFLSYSVAKKFVMIDPGHGGEGDDGLGARAEMDGKNIYEKLITLNFAQKLGRALERMGYQVAYTRIEDKKIPLAERTSSANKDNAKVFISLHANSSIDNSIKGADVFYMSEDAEDNYSELVAKQENLLLGGKKTEKEVNDVLKSMMVSSHIKESSRLAYEISSRLPVNLVNRGVKKAPFAVLHSAYMPSVLIELGFMTNEVDLRNMTNDKWLKSIAYDVARGVDSYFSKSKEE